MTEIPLHQSNRYEPRKNVNEAAKKLTNVQQERAILGLEVLNLALDELNYEGKSLPLIVFINDLSVDGTPRVGAFTPKSTKYKRPVIYMDVGDHPATKYFGEELISHLLQSNHNQDLINKMAIVDTFFEEANHFIDFTQGILPKDLDSQGKIRGFTGEYYDQPHEKRAREFAESMLAKHFTSLVYLKKKLY